MTYCYWDMTGKYTGTVVSKTVRNKLHLYNMEVSINLYHQMTNLITVKPISDSY